MSSKVPALMRVVRYDKRFNVIRDYTTYQLTVPSIRPKDYKAGSGTRIWCDGMAIGAMLVCESYIGNIRGMRTNRHVYRAHIKGGGCMVIVPANMYRANDIDSLMDKERAWHSEEGWIQHATTNR